MSAKRVLALLFGAVALGCASLVGVGDLTVQDADAPVEAGCGWPGPDGGLIAYYAFEEQSGASTVDCSGHGHTAVLINTKAGWLDAGFRGGAVSVSSSGGDYGCMALQWPDGFEIPRSPFSLSVFVRPDLNAGYERWVLGRSEAGSTKPGWGVIMATDATSLSLKFFNALDDGGDYNLAVSGSWADGAWHHIIVMVPPDGGVTTVMIDDASATDPNAPPINASQTEMSLGCRGDGNYPLVGTLDEVRVYDHVLDASELNELQ